MTDSLPAVGLGTWQNTDPNQCARRVANALEIGYRHVDTARFYGNEKHVGEGIAAADVPREDAFLASKIHPEAEGAAYDEVYDGIEKSLSLLDGSHGSRLLGAGCFSRRNRPRRLPGRGRLGELRPGHVITIEPGLYDPEVGGVRIEDIVVVVTEDGYENRL